MTTVEAGLAAGFYFAFSAMVMKALDRLPAAEGVNAMQSINRAAPGPFVAAFIGTALVCVALAVVGSVSSTSGGPLPAHRQRARPRQHRGDLRLPHTPGSTRWRSSTPPAQVPERRGTTTSPRERCGTTCARRRRSPAPSPSSWPSACDDHEARRSRRRRSRIIARRPRTTAGVGHSGGDSVAAFVRARQVMRPRRSRRSSIPFSTTRSSTWVCRSVRASSVYLDREGLPEERRQTLLLVSLAIKACDVATPAELKERLRPALLPRSG